MSNSSNSCMWKTDTYTHIARAFQTCVIHIYLLDIRQACRKQKNKMESQAQGHVYQIYSILYNIILTDVREKNMRETQEGAWVSLSLRSGTNTRIICNWSEQKLNRHRIIKLTFLYNFSRTFHSFFSFKFCRFVLLCSYMIG